MKYTILDFERSEMKRFNKKSELLEYCNSVGWDFDYLTRYIHDWSLKNTKDFNEWLEVNCHNGYGFIFPTNAIDHDGQIFEMIEYWHENIAFGTFGSEPVAFEFNNEKLNKKYAQWLKEKYINEQIEETGILEVFDWHEGCIHETDSEVESCEEYQLNRWAYDNQGFYFDAPEEAWTSKQDMLNAIMGSA